MSTGAGQWCRWVEVGGRGHRGQWGCQMPAPQWGSSKTGALRYYIRSAGTRWSPWVTTGLELGAKVWVQGCGQPLGTRQSRRCGAETAAPASEPETEAPSTCWTRRAVRKACYCCRDASSPLSQSGVSKKHGLEAESSGRIAAPDLDCSSRLAQVAL